MIIALSTLLYIDEKVKGGIDFKEICSTGIKNVELSFPVHANQQVLDGLSSFGLKVFSAHADFIYMDISSSDRKIREKSINIIKERIAFLKKAKGSIMVVHPGDFYNTQKEKKSRIGFSVESAYEIALFAQKFGIRIALENMPNSFTGDLPEDLMDIVSRVRKRLGDEHTVGICLDTGHAFLTNTLEIFLNDCFDEIITMHIHDNMGDINRDYRYAMDDRHMVPGKGLIDWDRFMSAVKNSYKGGFVFEVELQKTSRNTAEAINDLSIFVKRAFKGSWPSILNKDLQRKYPSPYK
ncbi:MAG: sugar phosphate isomerase/epimerase [Actinobacteria bacterium]|nr:sugar phosphate isomerase/epimerase [Actinomycetota bacterium]